MGDVRSKEKMLIRRVVILMTRDPGGRATGRVTVLRTMLDCLDALGYDVVVVLFARAPAVDSRWSRRHTFRHIPLPGLPRVAINAAGALIAGGRSLNESLYRSPGIRRRVMSLVAQVEADAVIADSLRLAEYAEATGLPYLVDLDDLLSERYAELAQSGRDTSELLGFFGQALPGWTQRPAGMLARRSLRWEAKACRRRELAVARRATAVSLVSGFEAERLAVLSGRSILTLPVGVAIAPVVDSGVKNRQDLLFLGGLDYQANVDALRWYLAQVLPLLGDKVPTLRVIGHCPPGIVAEMRSPHIVFEGYVEDLQKALSSGSALIAPIVSGTGVKTKVLDAMACGLPVIGTPLAFTGLAVSDGVEGYIGQDAAQLADRVAQVLRSPEDAVAVGLRGREYVAANFAFEIVCERWAQALTALIDAPSI